MDLSRGLHYPAGASAFDEPERRLRILRHETGHRGGTTAARAHFASQNRGYVRVGRFLMAQLRLHGYDVGKRTAALQSDGDGRQHFRDIEHEFRLVFCDQRSFLGFLERLCFLGARFR